MKGDFDDTIRLQKVGNMDRILLVDDEKDIVEALKIFLSKEDFELLLYFCEKNIFFFHLYSYQFLFVFNNSFLVYN